ncbi:hypothetical protein HK405_006572 [Cladochytrium tenue]|nr:hypothetical protein HK405_006572 [Cladochytrium tenue]
MAATTLFAAGAPADSVLAQAAAAAADTGDDSSTGRATRSGGDSRMGILALMVLLLSATNDGIGVPPRRIEPIEETKASVVEIKDDIYSDDV